MKTPIIGIYSWEQFIILILFVIIVLIIILIIGYKIGEKETRKTIKESIHLKQL